MKKTYQKRNYPKLKIGSFLQCEARRQKKVTKFATIRKLVNALANAMWKPWEHTVIFKCC